MIMYQPEKIDGGYSYPMVGARDRMMVRTNGGEFVGIYGMSVTERERAEADIKRRAAAPKAKADNEEAQAFDL